MGYLSNNLDLVISYAEEVKKSYEEIEKELLYYKNAQMLEAGFRTVDIIFGWNNVFSQVGHFCDSIINVLDNYYLWTPIKYSVILIVGFYIGMFFVAYFAQEMHVVDFSDLAEQAKQQGGIYIENKDNFINDVLTRANFEKGEVIKEFQVWKVKK